VVLTPALQAGSKDKALAILGAFARKNKLKGFAPWDSDQVRTFLDALPEVRQTYASWITTGDVLTHVINQLQWQRSDFETSWLAFSKRSF
jgi:hypothetical protein